MKARLMHILLSIALLVVVSPIRAEADTDFRTRMLIVGLTDGYPGDDDVTAIGRYLHVAGDQKITTPDDLADWINARISDLGPIAVPRLSGSFVHFLRGGAMAPPFACGVQGSARNRLLRGIANSLKHQGTPLADLALLMFEESDDPFLSQMANSADYSSLRSFPWLVGDDDWMSWILIGLNPNNKPNPGMLPHVRSFFANLDVRPPVTASGINFLPFNQY